MCAPGPLQVDWVGAGCDARENGHPHTQCVNQGRGHAVMFLHSADTYWRIWDAMRPYPGHAIGSCTADATPSKCLAQRRREPSHCSAPRYLGGHFCTPPMRPRRPHEFSSPWPRTDGSPYTELIATSLRAGTLRRARPCAGDTRSREAFKRRQLDLRMGRLQAGGVECFRKRVVRQCHDRQETAQSGMERL